MTKAELIQELNSNGCFDSEIYSMNKKQLEDKLQNVKTAKSMSMSDLLAHIKF